MVFARWRARRADRQAVATLAAEVTRAARREALFARLGVADTPEGRFEMVALHASLAMRRLAGLGEDGRGLAHELANALFGGFDDALREMSISDAGIAKRMTRLAEAFYGRIAAYDKALAPGGEGALTAALARNVYAQPTPDAAPLAAELAHYAFAQADGLNAFALADFRGAAFTFPTPEIPS